LKFQKEKKESEKKIVSLFSFFFLVELKLAEKYGSTNIQIKIVEGFINFDF